MSHLVNTLTTIFCAAACCTNPLAFSQNLAANGNIQLAVRISALEKVHRLKQDHISTCADLPPNFPWKGSELSYIDGELTIAGTDNSGHKYLVMKGTSELAGCDIWAMDSNGPKASSTLIILTRGTDSSGGYDSQLSLVLFDKDSHPFPWQAMGMFNEDADGIKQLLAGPTGRGTSVIVSTKEGLNGPDAGLAFQLYRFTPNQVSKESGQLYGMAWPAFQNPTPALLNHQQASSLTFNLALPASPAKLAKSQPEIISATSKLALQNGQQLEPPAVIVQDAQDGSRIIQLDPIPKDVEALLQTQASVQTFGRSCEEEECRPFILVAQ